jgi:hypothetical protein
VKRAGGALLAIGLAFAAGCAPRLALRPETSIGERMARYRVLVVDRESKAIAMTASLSLWVERAGERMPGAQAELRLAAPDRMRLRIASAFGTAIDLGLAGDSLRAYVPGWRTGLRLDAASESLGFEAPADRMVRALSATWRPPSEAWGRATWSDSLVRVRWTEAGDSLAIGVGASGLPAWAELAVADGPLLRVHYRGWDRSSGGAWPSYVELVDEDHALRVMCRANQIKFAPEPDRARLAVRWPPGTTPVTLGELRAALGRLGFL